MQFYTLIYRYRGKGSHIWTRQFTSLYSPPFTTKETDLYCPRMMRLGRDDPWEAAGNESARSWLSTFMFALRWALILDPRGRVVHEWRSFPCAERSGAPFAPLQQVL